MSVLKHSPKILWHTSHWEIRGRGQCLLPLNRGSLTAWPIQYGATDIVSCHAQALSKWQLPFPLSFGWSLLALSHHAVRKPKQSCGEAHTEKNESAPTCQPCVWALLQTDPGVPDELSQLKQCGVWVTYLFQALPQLQIPVQNKQLLLFTPLGLEKVLTQ